MGPAGAPWGATPQGVWGPPSAALRRAPGRTGGCCRGALGTPQEPARRGRRRGMLGGAAGVVAPKGRLNFLSAKLVPGAVTNLYP